MPLTQQIVENGANMVKLSKRRFLQQYGAIRHREHLHQSFIEWLAGKLEIRHHRFEYVTKLRENKIK